VSAGQLNGIAVASIGAGALLTYAAVQGKTVLGTIQAVIRGQSPSTAPDAAPASAGVSTAPAPAAGGAAAAGYGIATNIPAGQGSYTQAGVQALWTGNGGPADTAAFAAAVAMAESGGSATVTSANPDGGVNVGLFQLDTKGVGAGYPVADLQDANLNTQLTIMATRGGTDWTQWGDPVTAAVGYHYTPGSAVP
jgi:hypothetical protein